MTESSETPKRRLSTGLRILLGVSLTLNLLVAGIVIGAVLRADRLHMRGEPANAGLMLYRALPGEDRRALRQSLRGAIDGVRQRETRIGPELAAALTAEPFDIDAIRTLVERQHSVLVTGQAAMRETWYQLVADMTPQERIDYADRITEAMKRPRRKMFPDRE